MELKENFDFLYTQTLLPQLSNKNKFDIWLNDNKFIFCHMVCAILTIFETTKWTPKAFISSIA